MVYAGIVAGGKGLRMKSADKPKQFLEIGGEPILVRTVKAFLQCKRVDKIIVGINPQWKTYAQGIFEDFSLDNERVFLVEGGENRNSTIFNIVKEIRCKCGINQGDIILTHDAVRPFVSCDILEKNIDTAEKYKACGTYIPAVDTVVKSSDGINAGENLDRSTLYQAQTPQTFELSLLNEILEEMSQEEAEKATDVCGLFSSRGIDIKMVEGDRMNFKITTDFDYTVSKAICK